MNIQHYFARIGVDGPLRADLDSFRRLHRAHALMLSYENLDVQLGVPVSREIEAIFDKLVARGRGGWCYEMNGLLGWALEKIGFDVTRLCGAVMRDLAGDSVIGNHLVLLVRVGGEDWVGDVGFGDGLIEPVRLQDGAISGNPLACSLQRIEGGWWRYHNDPRSGGPNFDFNPDVAIDALLDDRCNFLQRDPASPFVQNAVVQRWIGDAHYSLRGRVLRVLTGKDEERSLVDSSADYVRKLREVFAIELPRAAELWPAICRRHDEVFAGRDPLV